MKNRSKNTKRNRKNGTAKVHRKFIGKVKGNRKDGTAKVHRKFNGKVESNNKTSTNTSAKTTDNVIIKLKGSLMDDKVIEMTIEMYKSQPSQFYGAIDAIKRNMSEFLNYGYDVITSYENLLQARVLRFGDDEVLKNWEKAFTKILFECFTEWRDEVVIHEMTKQMNIQCINGTRIISF